ncbi:MAG: lamin tail domain-containing protein [Planctomycetota bacterium]
MHYRDDMGWPGSADGGGPSLELRTDFWEPDRPSSWRRANPPGTPGRATVRIDDPVGGADFLLPRGATWRYLPGTEEPAASWNDLDFDDAGWNEGSEPFGYGDGSSYGTELEDMWSSYLSLYTRTSFDIDEETLTQLQDGTAEIRISVEYDDAFVAYLNDEEIGRDNLEGDTGEPVAHDARALEAQTSRQFFNLSGRNTGLRLGRNVLAIQTHNRSLFSGDFQIGATVRLSTDAPQVPADGVDPVINEVQPGKDGSTGFIEIYFPGPGRASLDGLTLTDSPYRRSPYVFPRDTELVASEFLVLDEDELGFALTADSRSYLLLDEEGDIVDRFEAEPITAERSAVRFPDGTNDRYSSATPTPGAANIHDVLTDLVIHEIHYNPSDDDELPPPPAEGEEPGESVSLEFVELYNRSGREVPLEGWRLSGGVGFRFPPDSVIEAGSYVIVAREPEAVRDHYGLDESVFGPFSGRLGNGDDELNVRDPFDNLVDRVHYADDGDWPSDADGFGPSLELVHPELNNRYGRAWAAGPNGGTPGRANAEFRDSLPPIVSAVRHSPAIPRSDEDVVVRCRVDSLVPVNDVILTWANDTGNDEANRVEMNDAGGEGDEIAGDGVYSATIPEQGDQSVVRFFVSASNEQGESIAPRGGRFLLYEVNSTPILRAGLPHYSILMTSANWREIRSRGNGNDDLLDVTFVDHAREKTYYNVGLRYRGNGSRNPPDGRFNYRVQFPDDQKFRGLKRLNFNSQNPHRQLLGNRAFRRFGLPYPLTVPVSLRFNGETDERYVYVEAYDDEFLSRHFGGADNGGNLYRGLNGRLQFRGDEDLGPYRNRYSLITETREDSFVDLMELTRLFTIEDDEEFLSALDAQVDVFEWIRYFAAQGAFGNTENSINIDAGDDYFLFRRESDRRFVILPWDTDSVYNDTNQDLFRPSANAVVRLLRHDRFAPLYFCELRRMQRGLLSRRVVDRELERISPFHTVGDVEAIRGFVPARHDFLDNNISNELTVSFDVPAGTRLIRPGDEWAFWPGSSDPSGGDLEWTEIDFDDSKWATGPSGFGYGDGDDATVIDDMQDNYPSIFVRRRFRVDDPSLIENLRLRIDYDDGFVAYLNGREIARRNYEPAVPSSADTASRDREAGSEEVIDLNDFIDDLEAGDNLLAIVVFNGTIDSSDVSLIPTLEAEFSRNNVGGCGEGAVTSDSTLFLSGRAPACDTFSIELNGREADFVAWRSNWNGSVDLVPGNNIVVIEALDASGGVVETREIRVQRLTGFAELPSAIDENTTLDAAGGPYLVPRDVTISRGRTLTVEAGTELQFAGDAQLIVDGRLVARGTDESPILWTPFDCDRDWRGIHFSDVADSNGQILEHCEIVNASGDEAGITTAGPELNIRDSLIDGGDGFAIAVQGGSAEIERTLILSRESGVLLANGSASIDATAFSDLRVDGIRCAGGSLTVTGAEISAGSIGLVATGGELQVSQTLVSDCDTGISLTATTFEGDHLTVALNAVGIEFSGLGEGGSAGLQSSIVWANAVGAREANLASVSFSDVQDELLPGDGNISEDPLFRNAARGDFTLRDGSPALGTGADGNDMGAFPSDGPTLFIRGDTDANGVVNLSDAIATLASLFRGAGRVPCEDGADANDDGSLNLTDPVLTLNHLFLAGPGPAAPYPNAGSDPSADNLGCDAR